MYIGIQENKIKFYINEVTNPEFYPETTWLKTEDEYVLNDDMSEYIKKPDNYEEILAQKERDRLNSLSLTSADVERALYKAKGIDFDDVIELAKQANEVQTVSLADDEPANNKIDIKALKIELKANSFYRGHPFLNQIGTLLGYTSDDLDYLFINKELPEKTLDDVIEATEEAGLYGDELTDLLNFTPKDIKNINKNLPDVSLVDTSDSAED